MNITPICNYCNTFSVPTTGKEIYPHREDLHYKKFYKCPNDCGAYVGCHPDTDMPLGRLANKSLRNSKSATHRAFDPLWKGTDSVFTRKSAYVWLAKQLSIDVNDCHIGLFDEARCNQVMRICADKRKEIQQEK